MKTTFGLLIAGIVLAAPLTMSHAHGVGPHVMGTVVAIDATHVEVKSAKSESISILLTGETQYRSKGGAKNLPQVGDRVVIETRKDGMSLLATEVRFSSPGVKPKSTP